MEYFNAHSYQNLNSETAEDEFSPKQKEKPSLSQKIVVLYAIITFLLFTQLSSIVLITSKHSNPLGSYETGFSTEIHPNQNTLALHKVKFYGGVVFDENGTVSLSYEPGQPDYFGTPSLSVEAAWDKLLNHRFIKVEPKDWPKEAVRLGQQDLVRGSWRLETSGLHALHCLNYVRKSLSPEYYESYRDKPEQSSKSLSHSGHLKHCLSQIHQNIMCHLDMTPTPRTWRPAPAGDHGQGLRHADTDQWHVCRNFEALRDWMYPLQEFHD
ncbi:hypothetical protein COCCADRAFT_113398 [Bipolaris zeicola 26-R-13]|uniref:DUF3328 domain-containing protein n=1 Tax=Cochliobolus carbonum (strain 26-R-13) TaxID=930089 RepID=W6XNF5_COCC2|nr:uncharacterized protein COCCADRAFT_113398 [Bipolaris zeicola 26-R-13]EUC26780.1 hypothetical protein COCCADRAFT_113398 [Bipolaris zeicola 26-R-13]